MKEYHVVTDVQTPAYSVESGKTTFWISEDINFLIPEGKTFGADLDSNIKHNEELFIVSGVFSSEVKIDDSVIKACQEIGFYPRLLFKRNNIFTYQICISK